MFLPQNLLVFLEDPGTIDKKMRIRIPGKYGGG